MEDPYLSELASLASTALAIALAYLNLDRLIQVSAEYS